MQLDRVECMEHACLFFLTEAKIPDREIYGQSSLATRNSGGVHGACLLLFPNRGQKS